MIHARKDYDRIQDPAVNNPELLAPGCDPIWPDEPVFILRASDKLAPVTVYAWLKSYIHAFGKDADTELIKGVDQHIHKMLAWQAGKGYKLPDTPNGMMKVETNG